MKSRRKRFRLVPVVALSMLIPACSGSETAPTSSAPAIPAILPPTPIGPAGGVLIGDLEQPVTLSAAASPEPASLGPIRYEFQVTTDPSFSSVKASGTLSNVNGDRVSWTADRLPPGLTYYWRVWTTVAAGSSPSPTSSFKVGPTVASGPWRMTIDATPACGGLFNQTLVLDGDLVRTASGLVFGRKVDELLGYKSFDRMDVRLTFAGTTVSGNTDFIEAYVTSPPTLAVNGDGGNTPIYPTSGTVSADGTLSGTFVAKSDELTLYVLPIGPGSSRQDCKSTFNWRLTPR